MKQIDNKEKERKCDLLDIYNYGGVYRQICKRDHTWCLIDNKKFKEESCFYFENKEK